MLELFWDFCKIFQVFLDSAGGGSVIDGASFIKQLNQPGLLLPLPQLFLTVSFIYRWLLPLEQQIQFELLVRWCKGMYVGG